MRRRVARRLSRFQAKLQSTLKRFGAVAVIFFKLLMFSTVMHLCDVKWFKLKIKLQCTLLADMIIRRIFEIFYIFREQ